MYRILILDDEIRSAQLMKQLLQKNFPYMESISIVQNISEAVTYLNQYHADLVLLDLHLNGESGFDLLDEVSPRKFDFICISASDEYAMKAFEYNASGYLLKPVSGSMLASAMNTWFSTRNKAYEKQTSLILNNQINSNN